MVVGLAARSAPIEAVEAFVLRWRPGADIGRLRAYHGQPRPAGWARMMARQTPAAQLSQAREMTQNVIASLAVPRHRWADCAAEFLVLGPTEWTEVTREAVVADIAQRAEGRR